MAEESFERLLEVEVVIGVVGTGRSLELNQKVEVAQAWFVGSSSSGAEEVKPTDPVSPAKAGQFCVTERDVWGHGLIPRTGYPLAFQPVTRTIAAARSCSFL